MRISRRGDYAFRALIYLALHADKDVIQLREVAEREAIPRKFLEQIMRTLKGAGYLQAKSGIGGGYSLRRDADTVTLGEIVRLIDGPLAPVGCVSVTAPVRCPKERTCGLRSILLDVRNLTARIMDTITIADVCARIRGDGRRVKKTFTYYV